MRAMLSVLLLSTCAAVSAQAPKVESISPAHLDVEVDAGTTVELVVVFDRDMDTGGMSVLGGGRTFPKLDGRPKWRDARTFVMSVTLEPGRNYEMSLNGGRSRNFRSKQGVALQPVPWLFWTLPAELPDAQVQRQRNERALGVLMQTLRERYSYYDRCVDDWAALEQRHRAALLAARTDRGFAAAAARMLKATEDLHLFLTCDAQMLPTGSRVVDPMFREPLLARYVTVEQAGRRAVAGRTDDGIGYLLIASWTRDIEPHKIGAALAAMADTKALIVDVRPNAGGDERLAQQVAGWFVKGTKVYATHRSRERAGRDGFGNVQAREISGHGPERHYRKPVVLLTSRYVMSSSEAFVLMMKQAEDCLVVGQPTYGSSGNPKPFELGNGVTLVCPTWQAMLPDGAVFEGEGLAPDEFVPCTPDDFERRDPILEKALALLRARIGE